MFLQTKPALRKSLSGAAVARIAEALAAAESCPLSPAAAQMVAEALELLQAPPAATGEAPAPDNRARYAFGRLLYDALDAVQAAHGWQSWHTVPGNRYAVRVPADVARYVDKRGKVQRGERVRTLPGPQWWPGGEYPPGCVVLCPAPEGWRAEA